MPESPECPRCGYDLSGEVSRWVVACPLVGVCSECGLAFGWGRVLRVERWRVRGFVEDARGWRQRFAWVWVTWLWTFWPPTFWRRVGLERPVRAARVWVWLLIVYGTLHIAAVALNSCTIATIHLGARGWAGGNLRWVLINTWGKPFVSLVPAAAPAPGWRMVFAYAWPAGVWVLLGMSLAMPGMLLLLPWTRARARVKAGHVLRGAVYGLGWVGVPAAAKAMVALVVWIGFAVGVGAGAGAGANAWGARCANLVQSAWYSFEYDWWGAWLIGGLAWCLVWWWAALKIGFRLERVGVVFLALAIPALLVGLIAFCLAGAGA